MQKELKNMKSDDHQIGMSSVMGVAAESELVLKRDVFEHGRREAIAGGDVRLDPDRLRALEEHAEAMAREQGAAAFDTRASVHDDERRQECERAKQRMVEHEDGVRQAEDEVRRRRDGLAEIGAPLPAPEVPWFLALVGTLLIGLSVAPTLHDFFFSDFEDSRQAWFLSMAGGTVAGGFVSWALVGTFEMTQFYEWLGLAAGVVFGVALLLVRLTGAESALSVLMAVGLALLELSVVLFLDWAGRGLRHEHQERVAQLKELAPRQALLTAAERELAYRREEHAKCEAVVRAFVEHVREREARLRMLENLVNGCRKAVRDGYLAGITEKQGAHRGRRKV